MDKVTKKQIADKVGREVRTITLWADAGLISDEKPGKGRTRNFTERSEVEAGMVQHLLDIGVETRAIKLCLDYLRKEERLNFFDDPEYGRTREVFFTDWHAAKGYGYTFHAETTVGYSVVAKKNLENPKSVVRIISLGEVKLQALKLINK